MLLLTQGIPTSEVAEGEAAFLASGMMAFAVTSGGQPPTPTVSPAVLYRLAIMSGRIASSKQPGILGGKDYQVRFRRGTAMPLLDAKLTGRQVLSNDLGFTQPEDDNG